MSDPDPGPEPSCCHRCVSFIVTSGFTALFLWLTFRVTSPTCSIEQFDAFALQKPTTNQTIHYDLKLKNRNSNKGIYYDTLNLTFYYKKPDPRNATVSAFILLGNSTFGHFYQGHQKSTHRFGDINATGLFSGKNVVGSGAGPGNGSGFRVQLETAVRYKVIFWKTKRHRLVVGAELGVDGNGSLVRVKKNKGIKLIRSGVGDWKRKNGCFGVRGILGILILFLFW